MDWTELARHIDQSLNALLTGTAFPDLPRHFRLAIAGCLLAYTSAVQTGNALAFVEMVEDFAHKEIAEIARREQAHKN